MFATAHFASLSFRVTRLVVLLALTSAALAAVTALRPMEQRMRTATGEQQFAILKMAAASLDVQVEARRTLLRTAVQRVEAELRLSQQAVGLLANQASLNGQFSSVFLLDAGGKVVAGLETPKAVGQVATGLDGQLDELFTSGAGTTARALLSGNERLPALFILEPVRDEGGTIRYVLAGGIDLGGADISGQLDAATIGRRGYLYVVDLNGTILHHPDKRRINELADSSSEELRTALLGFEGWREGTDVDGEPALLGYKRLRAVPWIVAAVCPIDDAYADATQAQTAALFTASLVAITTAVAGLFLALRLLRPFDELHGRVREIVQGEADVEVLDTNCEDEIGALGQAFLTITRKCAAAEDRLARLAFTDALTGIANRRMLEEALAHVIARGRRVGHMVAVAYLDIDRFKSINDTMGHMAGDAILVEFAARLKTAVRSHDTVARFAGDEFMIVFDGVTGVAETEEAARRILGCFKAPFTYGSRSLRVTTSIGIALQRPETMGSAMELIARADAALYRAKRGGRNRYMVEATAEKMPDFGTGRTDSALSDNEPLESGVSFPITGT
ncbi:MAG: diguanylate cyclase [Alphaproteobacteria bacterium]|nr:MAG: diguanylate cyclase [Alphaproteobacteria bacterium]